MSRRMSGVRSVELSSSTINSSSTFLLARIAAVRFRNVGLFVSAPGSARKQPAGSQLRQVADNAADCRTPAAMVHLPEQSAASGRITIFRAAHDGDRTPFRRPPASHPPGQVIHAPDTGPAIEKPGEQHGVSRYRLLRQAIHRQLQGILERTLPIVDTAFRCKRTVDRLSETKQRTPGGFHSKNNIPGPKAEKPRRASVAPDVPDRAAVLPAEPAHR